MWQRSCVIVAMVVVLGPSAAAAQTRETGFLNRAVTVAGETYRFQVFVPTDYTPSRAWPVVLFLHGGGERGTDGIFQTEVGIGSAVRRFADRFAAIVVMPQARPATTWSGAMANVALAALGQTESEFVTDPARVYLTGLSLGGAGTWYLAYRHTSRFAALLVICARVRPGPNTTDPVVPAADGEPFSTLAARVRQLPIWVYHGDADPTVPVDESRGIVAALRALNAPVRYSELSGVGHNSWDAAYRSPEVIAWLLAQRRP